jgi:hypothetical protein
MPPSTAFKFTTRSTASRTPRVLLHGGGDTIGTNFGHILPVLACDREIVAFEQQGYGHTADIADRPFQFRTIGGRHRDPRHRRANAHHSRRRRPYAPRTRRRDVSAPPRAQRAVLLGTEHMTMMTRTAWLEPMIDEFLAQESRLFEDHCLHRLW